MIALALFSFMGPTTSIRFHIESYDDAEGSDPVETRGMLATIEKLPNKIMPVLKLKARAQAQGFTVQVCILRAKGGTPLFFFVPTTITFVFFAVSQLSEYCSTIRYALQWLVVDVDRITWQPKKQCSFKGLIKGSNRNRQRAGRLTFEATRKKKAQERKRK